MRQHHVEPLPTGDIRFEIVKDLDDRIVLQSAISARAEVLITGDRDLTNVSEQVTEVRVLTPREFWESLRTSK